ncbi:MAG: AI-2E family transporter [Clostridiaceae bacterium]|nr:AI-2E family transporter [Clostridiaceae bacterium]
MTDKDDKNKKLDADSPQRMQLLLPPKFFWRIFLVLAALTLFFLFIWNISWFWKNLLALLSMLTPFIVGAALAFVIKIPMNAIERQLKRIACLQERRGLRRVFSIILSLLFVTVFIAGVFTLVMPQLVQSINMLVARMPDFVKKVADRMEDIEFLEPYAEGVREELGNFSWKLIVEKLGSFLRSGAGVFNNVITAVGSIMSGLTNTIISLLFMLYMLAAKERVGEHSRRLIYSFSREKIADKIIYVFHIMHENFTAFVSSTVVGAAVAGVLTFVAMVILRLPYAGMISVVVGVSNLIPIIGSIVGVGIGTLIILIVSPIQALVFLIAAILANQIEGNILFPKLMGKVMGLPAMWSLLAISLGGSLLGIIGIWFFVPLFASAYALLAEATAVRLQKRQIDIAEKAGADVAYKVRLDMGMSEEEAQAWERKKGSPKAARDNFKKSLKRIRAKISRKK